MIKSKPDRIRARLALEDGTIFQGLAFGAAWPEKSSTGEVVFNTAMTGYQEALTDPSYAGQILTMTTPMIGNYGVTVDDVESSKPQVAGFIVRELARLRSNQRSVADLGDWLAKAGILGIEGIDTRALVRRLRLHGAMRGVISSDASISDLQLVEMARNSPVMTGCNLAAGVSPRREFVWNEEADSSPPIATRTEHGGTRHGGKRLRVLALDCGAKRSIYRHLSER
ncbi:MAG: carbamoyl phosphate synthase small subunit, partial [Phycisphaerales bacterium]|nr:carbamoyl phosphate synthase small subunit [Phycisphaerales bacterium]